MALAIDATSSSSSASASSLTWSHTCTGTDRILVVAVNWNSAATTISSVTYNGVAMTLIKLQNTGANRGAAMYSLLAPATGANNIVVTLSTSDQIEAGGVSFTGGNAVNNELGTETPSGTTYSLTVTTASGNYVVASITTGNRTVTPTTSSTEIYTINPTDQRGEAHYIAASGATQVMTAIISSAAGSAFVAANIVAGSQGGGGAATPRLRSLLGVGL